MCLGEWYLQASQAQAGILPNLAQQRQCSQCPARAAQCLTSRENFHARADLTGEYLAYLCPHVLGQVNDSQPFKLAGNL